MMWQVFIWICMLVALWITVAGVAAIASVLLKGLAGVVTWKQ